MLKFLKNSIFFHKNYKFLNTLELIKNHDVFIYTISFLPALIESENRVSTTTL